MQHIVAYRLEGPGNPIILADSLLNLIRQLALLNVSVTGGEEANVTFRLDPHRLADDLSDETIELITALEPHAAYKPGPHFGHGVSPIAERRTE